MKIISLVDNCALPKRRDLRTEPGLSLFIETNHTKILFDTGLEGAFLANAEQLAVAVPQVDLGILSHHHYDHGGGLSAFLAVNLHASVFLRRSETENLSLRMLGLFKRQVGLDASLFQNHPARFHYVDAFSEIAAGVFILTDISRQHPEPKGNRNLYNEQARPSRRDDFSHELVLVIKERQKLVVFTGCSHHGILNVLDTVTAHFPGEAIHTLIGGFHLIDPSIIDSMAGSRQEVAALGREILHYPLGKVYTGHCTGRRAYRILKRVMREKLAYLACGDCIEL